jgi:hypothetical protein
MKINYRQIYLLLGRIPSAGIPAGERLETWVSSASGGRTSDVKELDGLEYRTMITGMQTCAARHSPRMAELEIWRRRVIGAVCEYHSLAGYYRGLTDAERIAKAKGEAVRAKGNLKYPATDIQIAAAFNRIPVCELQAIYNGKIRQNRILKKVNAQFEKDLMSDEN